MSRLRLRLQHTEIDLPDGELIIGRAPTCRVRIDHPAISRRHAKLLVSADSIEIEDLGSRNGVFVNGQRLLGRRLLAVGDRIAIGNAEFQLVGAEGEVQDPERTTGSIAIRRCPWCNRMYPSVLERCPGCRGPTRTTGDDEFGRDSSTSTDGSMHVLAGVGEKALAMGRVEEAERLIGRNLEILLERVRDGQRLDQPLYEDAVRRAIRLASATKRDEWYGWIFDFAAAQEMLLPGEHIDELHSLMFAHRPDVGSKVDAYIARMSSVSLRPPEQQLLKRITGLRRFAKD